MSEIQFYADKSIGGINGWYWPSYDVQTWGIIANDWEQSHRKAIMSVLSQLGKKFDVVIQAGGNCGMYPRLLSQMFKQVYTFEPDPANFYVLNLNCAVPNVYKMQAALGAKAGNCGMVHRAMVNVGMHQVSAVADPMQPLIPLIPLDAFDFPVCDLLWLDIEDYEAFAIQGARETIARTKPVVMTENATEEVQGMMGSLGYKKIGDSAMDGIFIPA